MHGKITKEMAWELSGMSIWMRHGFSFFDLRCEFQKRSEYMDHTPNFNFFLVLLNIKLIDFSIYSIYHVEDWKE
jgi:hypothetical protein